MEESNALERAVLEKLFDGPHPALRSLLRQALVAKVVSRKLTGAGFFTSFAVPEVVAAAVVPSAKIRFGDVGAKVPGLEHDAGFLAYVDDGKLSMLEGYCYDGEWPALVENFELHYLDSGRQAVEKTFGPMP